MVTAAEFWATKRRRNRFDTVAFEHSLFAAPFRLVANVFSSVTLGGNAYTPVPMQIGDPKKNADGQPQLTVTFPRAVVGRQFKQALALISGSREPITVTRAIWLEDVDAPKVTWPMYAADNGGIRFGRDSVQVVARLDNPMLLSASLLYLPDVFVGLASL